MISKLFKKINKLKRKQIHKFIVSCLITLPILFSCSTLYKLKTDDNFPRKTYETLGEGYITKKFVSTSGDLYFVLDDYKTLKVNESSYRNNEIGNKIRLTSTQADLNGADALSILFMWICFIAFAFVILVQLPDVYEKYFCWVRGDDDEY